MKFRLLIPLIVFCLFTHAQPPPAGFAQVYVYGERENLPPGSNYSSMMQEGDGSLVAHPYSRDWFRLRNTTLIPLTAGKSLAGRQPSQLYTGSSFGGWFSMADEGLFQLKGDTFFTKPDWKKPITLFTSWGNKVICVEMNGNKQRVLVFDGKKWEVLKLPMELYDYPQNYLSVQSGRNGNPFVVVAGEKSTEVFRYDSMPDRLVHVASYNIQLSGGNGLYQFADTGNFIYSKDGNFFKLRPGKNSKPTPHPDAHIMTIFNSLMIIKEKDYSVIHNPDRLHQRYLPIGTDDRLQSIIPDKFGPGYFVGGAGSLFRVFPYIRQFPKLYNQSHSSATHTLMQTEDGTVFAGSYNGQITAIRLNMVLPIQTTGIPLLPGGVGLGNRIYYFYEKSGQIGTNSLNKNAGKMPIADLTSGYYLKPSPNGKQVFAGFSGAHGIGIIDKTDFVSGKNTWRYIDSTKGMRLYNVLTVTEDPLGRLWFARSSEGWGVYNPATDKAVTYRIPDGETSFGAMASALDSRGTIWLGGNHGLWYCDARKKAIPTHKDMQRFEHPLLTSGDVISSLTTWKQHLVVGIGKRVLLIDLHDFYSTKNTRQKKEESLPKVRYINQHELDMTAELEQNIFLVDHKDSSLWLATNNNVYNIDLHTWLNLPTYTAKPTISLIAGADTFTLRENEPINLAPTSNSLQMQVLYQTLDNMPRLIQGALQAEGDTLRWSPPTTDNTIIEFNRQTGNYTFFIRIFQSDGTITTHSFPITIRRFLWQQWWFWLLISSVVMGVSFYLFYLHKQKQLADAEAKRVKAEAEALRSEQQRQLTSMQVKSLSTQFRPHFILNALNTVGAQLYDKPEVDAVLGQLGDSIGIIFRNAQSGAIAHPLSQEWRLVVSVINIKQLELQNTVTVHLDVPENLLNDATVQVPMGILQIPVENALVHGLRNKETGAKDLWITATQSNEGELCVTIRDNGIGRKAAAAMGNYRSNGVGTRNIQAILDLLNPYNDKPITIMYRDEPFEEDGNKTGTEVTICIPKNYSYER